MQPHLVYRRGQGTTDTRAPAGVIVTAILKIDRDDKAAILLTVDNGARDLWVPRRFVQQTGPTTFRIASWLARKEQLAGPREQPPRPAPRPKAEDAPAPRNPAPARMMTFTMGGATITISHEEGIRIATQLTSQIAARRPGAPS